MRKKMMVLLVMGLLVLGITQLAYATDAVVNENPERGCFLDHLPDDVREQAENLIRDFHARMTALRARLAGAREAGDMEERNAVRSEMWDLKEERREEIRNLLPEDYRDQYMEGGFQGQKKHRPEDRPHRPGKGSHHSFERQSASNSI